MDIQSITLVIGVIALLWGSDRLLLWCESRGWIYYRRKKASAGSVASAALEMQKIFEPQKGHLLEVIADDDDRQDDERGEPDELRHPKESTISSPTKTHRRRRPVPSSSADTND